MRNTILIIMLLSINLLSMFTRNLMASDFQLIRSNQSLGNSSTFSIALGDIDNDGDIDIYSGNKSTSNRIWINNGNGIFIDSGQELGINYTTFVELADIDSDGDLDGIEGTWIQPNKIWINNGSGKFSDSGQNLGNNSTQDIALLDIEGDGDLDMACANWNYGDQVWVNDSTGNYTDSGQILGSNYCGSIVSGDIDSDGDVDLIIGRNFTYSDQIWLNDGAGNFTNTNQLPDTEYTSDIVLGDLNNDNDLDLVTIANGDNNKPKIWINNGSGQFTLNQNLENIGNNTTDVRGELADIDDDNDLDIILICSSPQGPIQIWQNNGSGIFRKYIDSSSVYDSISDDQCFDFKCGDVDNDGDLDMVLAMVGNYPNRILLNRIITGDSNLYEIGNVKIIGGSEGFVNPLQDEKVTITFRAARSGNVNVKIFTLTGQLVWEKGIETNGGNDYIEWACRNAGGEIVSSDVYIVKVDGPGIDETKKVVIMR